ncbi:MAG: 4Fe-4S dicluster domain-containing protein [Candidatus Lokiarchaeota archaeon]|nr:4Fe-4S dicluster domain-containing protein [Candidatus Lokiarchaeota archaeon]MBD3342793.1 4Fe-4S dicluster domain-containing protein [Candidatus Lokiarchaeota archaeon]
MSIRIDDELCTGCGNCVANCPYGGIEVIDDVACINDDCNLCGACVEACPVDAIILEREEFKVKKMDITQYNGVWIVAEHYNGVIHPVAFQLLGKGRELADKLNVSLTLVILGSDFDKKLDEISQYGQDEIIYVKSKILKDYYSDLYVKTLAELISERKPEIVLIGATPTGRDFAPRVAKRLGAGLTADCTGLDIEEESGNLRQTRPTFGGNIMATIRTPTSRPQMATVRPGIFKVPERVDKDVKITKLDYDYTEKDSVSKIVKVITKGKAQVNLEDAEIIVSGGRGVGSKEGFQLIEELADVLGAEVGGSRVTVELDWIEHDRQVGQTGKTVSPKLYVACGISGAIQHLVGMQGSDIIVAINKDPNAGIFKVAHYGIVGDLFKVIPVLIEQIKRVKAEEEA